ncbi:unnamed protein product [Phaeothamnion confervicola]
MGIYGVKLAPGEQVGLDPFSKRRPNFDWHMRTTCQSSSFTRAKPCFRLSSSETLYRMRPMLVETQMCPNTLRDSVSSMVAFFRLGVRPEPSLARGSLHEIM